MNSFKKIRKTIAPTSLIVFIILANLGCGFIIDKKTIRIAKIDDDYITRGHLDDLIFNMPDDKRPRIRTRNDRLRILEQYIDERIKKPLGKKLKAEGVIDIPRNIGRELYFEMEGENGEIERNMWNMPVPEPGAETELMRVYGLTADSLRVRKEIIDIETDRIIEKMLGDAAIEYMARRDYRAGILKPKQEEVEREYALRKDEFIKFESMVFRGLNIPVEIPKSLQRVEEARKRTEEGEDFEALLAEFYQHNPNSVTESYIENNPALTTFRGFWSEASGREVGDIVGPVFMPSSQRQREGGGAPITAPETWLLFEVIEHTPETIQTLEEATLALLPPILIAEKMKQLRQEHGVVIFKEKLADPKGFSSEFASP